MLTLHPNILEHEGQKQFAVLPYHEFLAIQEELQDFYDLKALRKAKQEEGDGENGRFPPNKKMEPELPLALAQSSGYKKEIL